MRILLSNDDGYFAPGLAALAAALDDLGTVTVVAPERDRSGASNSLTLDRPLAVRRSANGFLFVDGTPTDCVHLAVTGLLEALPDIVVSGINLGANMGDDTIYSGTVAAATEGYLLGIPSIAVSLTSKEGRYYETAGEVVRELVERFARRPAPQPVLLNVNVPDLPREALQGREIVCSKPIGSASSSYARLASPSSTKACRGTAAIAPSTVSSATPCLRSRATIRSRVRCEVMPTPRGSAALTRAIPL